MDRRQPDYRSNFCLGMGVFGLVGNLAMTLCILSQRQLRQMRNAFFLHGAFLNIVQCFYFIPFVKMFQQENLATGTQSYCRAVYTSYIVVMTAGMFNLLATSVAELYTFGEETETETAEGKCDSEAKLIHEAKTHICCVLFGVSFVYIANLVLLLGPVLIGSNWGCEFSSGSKNSIVFIMWIAIVTLALIITVYTLLLLYRSVRRYANQSVVEGHCQHRNDLVGVYAQAASNRTIVLILATVLCVVCWYPLFLLVPTTYRTNYLRKEFVQCIFFLMGWSRAAIEPYLFLLFDRKMKSGLVALTRWCSCRHQREGERAADTNQQLFPKEAELPLMDRRTRGSPEAFQGRVGVRLGSEEAERQVVGAAHSRLLNSNNSSVHSSGIARILPAVVTQGLQDGAGQDGGVEL